MGKIQITEGTVTDAKTSELHLISNHLVNKSAGIDDMIMYAEQRYLMTFLVGGITNGKYTAPGYTPSKKIKGGEAAATKIGKIPENEITDGISWSYKIMGRIQKSCEILGSAAVGTVTAGSSTTGGFFKLTIKDDYLKPGFNVTFYNGMQARVMGRPTGTPGNYVYNFQTYPGDTFSWATWVAGQTGTKTCFGGYTTYGERSLRGYGNVHYPDRYINHMTTQRKGLSISGDANSNEILWYAYNGKKGFVYESEQQARSQFLSEDEFQKWWGKSTMKDSNGNLLSVPSMTDDETGEPIYAGDGLVEQIRGANDMTTSGVGGNATYDDFSDMIKAIKKHFKNTTGKVIYAVTGSDGMQNAHDQIAAYGKNVFNITQNIDQTTDIGGASPDIGFEFQTLNVAGNKIVFVENTMMDDEQKFPRELSNGNLAMSSTYYFLDASPLENGKRNIEIKVRGRAGVNRNLVYYMENGMTGEGTPQSSVDAKKIEMLKQNMLVTYNTNTCGILEPSATA